MIKKMTLCLCCLLLIITGCNQPPPKQMPDLKLGADPVEFNTDIKLTAPKECNTYKAGKAVCLQIKNLSDKKWDYRITQDILIYQYENNLWSGISDKMMQLGVTELTLGEKGQFPLDMDIVDVIPDVKLDQTASLRIIILFHEKLQDKDGPIEGAFTDVVLYP